MAAETLSLILEIAVLVCEPCCDRGEVRVQKLSSGRSFWAVDCEKLSIVVRRFRQTFVNPFGRKSVRVLWGERGVLQEKPSKKSQEWVVQLVAIFVYNKHRLLINCNCVLIRVLNTLAQTNTMVTKLCGKARIHYNKCTAIMITVKGMHNWYTNITPQLKHQESIVVQSNAVIINSCTWYKSCMVGLQLE